MQKKVRVRFAPSPTGALHIGGVRTALYNYIFARQQGGEMLLRIEDTDQARLVPGAEEYILEALAWIGIQPDEGIVQGGPHSPYRQSERKEIYQEHIAQLLEAGHAYYAFDTPEELETMRERQKAAGVATPQYNAIARTTMKNSLTLPAEEVKARIQAEEPYVVRLKVPRKEEIRLNDMIRGWVMVHSSTLDDKVLLKSDGMPTYHLANVVDDHLMGITHVIRGEEWLPSAPTHVLLYKFFGWEDTMPQFAHLPLLLKPEGNGKLSKRDSQKHGFPIFPITWKDEDGTTLMGFREASYLPDALTNFLVFLGWNPGTEQELFTLYELIKDFSINRVHKGGVKFDIEKAQWYNQQYIKTKSDQELTAYLLPQLEKEGIQSDNDKVTKVCGLLKERVTFTHDFWLQGQYFFLPPQQYAPEIVQKKWTEEAVKALAAYKQALQNTTTTITAEQAKTIWEEVLGDLDIKMGKVMPALRLVITGVGGGPDLMEIISVIGRDETTQRIENALESLKNQVKV
jgi:glutamyl-tRNA synthetase